MVVLPTVPHPMLDWYLVLTVKLCECEKKDDHPSASLMRSSVMLIVPTAMEGEGGFELQLPYPSSFIVALPGDETHFDIAETGAKVLITVPGD